MSDDLLQDFERQRMSLREQAQKAVVALGVWEVFLAEDGENSIRGRDPNELADAASGVWEKRVLELEGSLLRLRALCDQLNTVADRGKEEA